MNISELLKLWRVEKGQPQLAKMPAGFYKEALALTKGANPYEAKKAKDVYNDIVSMRQHKIVMGCLRHMQGGDKPDNLLSDEKRVYDLIFVNLRSLADGVPIEMVAGPDLAKCEELAQEALPEPSVQQTHAPKKDPEEKTQSAYEASDEVLEYDSEPPAGIPALSEVGKDAGLGQADAVEQKDAKPDSGIHSRHAQKPKEDSCFDQQEKKSHAKGPKELFKEETENKGLMRVRFLRPMPAFVGPDMGSIGPFDKDQIVELDVGIAEILLDNDAVEELVVEEAENSY